MADDLLAGVFGGQRAGSRPIDDLFGPSAEQDRQATADAFKPQGEQYQSATVARARAIPVAAPNASPLDKVDVDIARRDSGREQQHIDDSVALDAIAQQPQQGDRASDHPGSSIVDSLFGVARSAGAGAVGGVGMGLSGLADLSEAATRRLDGLATAAGAPNLVDYLMAPANAAQITPGLRAIGDKIKAAGDAINVAPDQQGNPANFVANVVGQLGGQIVVGLAGGEVAAGALLYGQGANQIADAARKKGVEGSAGADAAILGGGALMGALEKTGLDAVLERVPPKIRNTVLNKIADYSLSAGAEATTEFAQQIVQNVAVKAGIDPDQAVLDGAGQSAAGGAVGGFLGRAILGAFGVRGHGYREIGGPEANADATGGPAGPSYDPSDYHVDARTGQPRTFATARQAAVYATSNQMGHEFNPEQFPDGSYGLRKVQPLNDDDVLTPADKASPIPDSVIAAGKRAAAGQIDPNKAAAAANAQAFDESTSAPSPAEAINALNQQRDAPLGAAQPDPIASFVAQTGKVESGGNATATNPNSSATGTHQFVASTWLDLMKRTRARQVAGMSDDQILAMRNNPLISAQMAAAYARENGAALQRAGNPVDNGTLYLAHFLGAGGANSVLSADPNTPVSTILSPGQVRANKSVLEGKTAGDVVAWAYGKMKATPGAAGVPPTDHPDALPYQQEGVNDFVQRVLGDEDGNGGDIQLHQAADADSVIDTADAAAPTPATPVGEPVANSAADLRAGVGAMGGGAVDGMYDMLLAKVDKGETKEAGQESALLQVAKAIKARGGTVDAGNIRSIAQDYTVANGGDQRDRGAALRAIVEKYAQPAAAAAPQAEAAAPVSTAAASALAARPRQVDRVARKGPVDVITFLADHGGISNEEGHDLGRNGRDLQRVLVPGAGALLRKKGMSIDEAGELLHEAGYVTGDRPTTADVLDLIDRGISDKIYRPTDTGEVMDAQAARQNKEDADRFRDDYDPIAKEYGVRLSDRDVLGIRSIEEDGETPHSAFVSYFEQEHSDATNYYDHEVNSDRYEAPDEQHDEGERASQEAQFRESGSRDEGSDDPSRDQGTAVESADRAEEGSRPPLARVGVSIVQQPSGKSVLVRGVPQEDEARIRAALPEAARPLWNAREKGWIISKKHEPKLRAALIDGKEPSPARTAPTSAAAPTKPAAEPQAEENIPAELRARPDDQRVTLERAAEGRSRSDVKQKAPGSDGGLFDDNASKQADIFDAPPKQEAKPEPEPAAAKQKPGYGDDNKLVSKARAEAIRVKLREKMRQLQSGVDPEALALFTELGVFHLEAGVRKFRDFARTIAADVGEKIERVRPFLRSAYNGARDLMEDSGHSVLGMETPEEVATHMRQFDTWANEPAETARSAAPARDEAVDTALDRHEKDALAHVMTSDRKGGEGWSKESPAYQQAKEIAEAGRTRNASDERLLEAALRLYDRKGDEPNGGTDLRTKLETTFADALSKGQGFSTITEARALAARETGEKFAAGTAEAKALDESIEAAVVKTARQIAAKGEGDPQATYQKLVDLYERQPRLGVRTSTSVEQQAYSTPVPLAYLASQRAGINQNTTVYEPSAGNGALLIDARATYVHANELNADRAAALRSIYRGADVTTNDAATYVPAEKVDAVIANPPFGPIKDNTGRATRFDVTDRYSTNEIDHAISLKALEAMKDNGRAVLIIGGVAKTARTEAARSDAYNGKAKREFFHTLYNAYNVTDHFTVAGELYERQGAGWPVDVIVIDGRGKSVLKLPAANVPRVYSSWGDLAEALNERGEQTATAVRNPDGSDLVEGRQQAGRADARDPVGSGSRRPDRRDGIGADDQPDVVRAGSSAGQPDRAGMGAGEAARAEAASDQGSNRPARRNQPAVAENDRQVAYAPGSAAPAMGTLVPVNMQTSISDALGALRSRVGDIDDYVGNKLGMSKTDLAKAFGGEQVDAVALAIDNIERGAGLINGDQTGIGKGRVAAGILRYAIREGLTPIFVTEKPNLYKDMYRDMADIGVGDMLGRAPKILMTDAAKTVPLDDDGKESLKTPAASDHNAALERIARDGLKASGYDVAFTTYSQMQALGGKETARQRALRAMANGGLVVLDESHNAGGQGPARGKKEGDAPSRAEFVREIVQAARGVLYSSATYAKRPDVMDLYAATDMKLAVDDISSLGEAIAKGGVPMQQIVASMLGRAGQYVRRERSFDGVNYNTPRVKVERAKYEAASSILKAIQLFSEEHVGGAAEKLNEELKAEAERVAYDGSTGSAGASSTNFTAIMHNVIDQMLLAFKVDDAADRAIAAIKSGEKPVITVANTLESLLTAYAEEDGIAIGQPIDITFADVFRRYLERSRYISVRKPYMKAGEKAEKKRLTDEDLGAAGAAAFRETMRMINDSGLESLPGSPIDAIISKVEQAGYKIGEITGRTLGISYRDGKAYLKARGAADKSIAGRINAIGKFNDGSTDAMLLNQAGSTGVSLHASERFKDQRKRRMIIAQAEKNIDTHMQMLGRVKRTGEVVLPEYDQLVADIPAEKRPASVLAKKMASLNANTTASRDSAVTAKDVPDFMNVYGDEVAARIMAEEPEIHAALGSPLSQAEEGESYSADGAMRKVTGRIPLLPLAEQEDLYRRLEGEYDEYLANKEAAGENALEAKTLDLDARTEATTEVVPAGAKTESPFAAPVNVETVSVKRLGKPHTSETVQNMVAEGRKDMLDTQAALKAGREFIRSELARAKTADSLSKRLNDGAERFRALTAGPVKVGGGVRLQTDNGNLYGIITSITKSGNAKNPIALGSWKATVALVDASRQITVPFSQLDVDNGGASAEGRIGIRAATTIGDFPISEAFDRMQTDSRETRHIITGNILSGFDFMGARGAIINFTDDKGQVRQGILAPRDWSLEKQQRSNGVPLTDPRAITDFLSMSREGSITGKGNSGDVVVQVLPTRHEMILTVAKSKKAGGEFFLNRDLTDALQTDFVSTSSGMVARTRADLAGPVLQVLMRNGVKFGVDGKATDEMKARAREVMQRYGTRYSQGTDTGRAVAPVDRKALQDQLTKLGLSDRVALDVTGVLFGNRKVAGAFRPGSVEHLISIATDSTHGTPQMALDHEAFHAIREMSLLKSAEWTAIKKEALSDPKRMDGIRKAYGPYGLTGEDLVEEAAASMFAEFQQGRRFNGLIRTALQRIADFFAAIRRAVTGQTTAGDVFRDIASGKVGERETGSGDAREWNVPSMDSTEANQQVVDGLRLSIGDLMNGQGTQGERLDRWRTKLQDRMLPLLRTQQGIELQSGRALPDSANPYRAEELMSGKTGDRLEKLDTDYVQPIYASMKAEKVSPEELESYLYARHAPERNARISEINSKFEEGTGSGMSDAEAGAIMARIDAEGRTQALERVAAKVDALLAFAVDTRVDAGLLSQDEADAWRSTYEHYVPLRGEAEVDPTEPDRPRKGSGINVRGKESQMAFGRRSRASDILAYSLLQAEEAVVRAGTNEVGQAFYRMAKANPNPEFWTINKVGRKPVFNKKTGQVSYRPESTISAEDKDYTVSLKIDGQERRVTMNRKNPAAARLASAMRNLDAPGLGAIVGFMSKFNRYLSTVNTMLAPEFLITNAIRDMQEASINSLEVKGLTKAILRDYRKAMVGAYKAGFGRDGGEWGQAYRDYVAAGGAVHFNKIDDLNDIKAQIDKVFEAHKIEQRGGARTPAEFALVARNDMRRLFGIIERMNLGVESAARLAAFKNLRDMGRTPSEAASFAKNLTVNFNRRGEWGPILNSMYLFYNAGVQGTARFFTAATRPGVRGNLIRGAMASAVFLGAALEMLNRMLSDDDDDGQSFYDKVPDFDKSRNLILMIPGAHGKYLKWPLPYGYNALYALGRAPVEVAHGGRKWQDSAANLVSTIGDAFNPIGGSNSLLNFIAPTIVDPAVDLYMNRDFAGKPIMPEQRQFGAKVPNNQRYWSSVNPNYKAITDFLNRATGGDDVVPGYVDWSPAALQYVGGVFTGSAGSFFTDKIGGTMTKVATGEPLEANDLPFARKLIGDKPKWFDKATFYARTDQITQAKADEKRYRDSDRPEAGERFEEKNEAVLSLDSAAKSAKKQMHEIRNDRDDLIAARDRGEVPLSQFTAQKKDIDAREQDIVSQFNGLWNSTLKP